MERVQRNKFGERLAKLILFMKIMSIAVSGLSIALCIMAVNFTPYFMANICICLVFSVVCLIGQVIWRDSIKFRKFDIGFHMVCGLCLFVTCVHFFLSVDEFVSNVQAVEGLKSKAREDEAMAAAAFGVIQMLLCGLICFLTWAN